MRKTPLIRAVERLAKAKEHFDKIIDTKSVDSPAFQKAVKNVLEAEKLARKLANGKKPTRNVNDIKMLASEERKEIARQQLASIRANKGDAYEMDKATQVHIKTKKYRKFYTPPVNGYGSNGDDVVSDYRAEKRGVKEDAKAPIRVSYKKNKFKETQGKKMTEYLTGGSNENKGAHLQAMMEQSHGGKHTEKQIKKLIKQRKENNNKPGIAPSEKIAQQWAEDKANSVERVPCKWRKY